MIITMENVIRDYGDSRVLDIDKLTIKEGIYVVLGSNGSGKSTLLSCISGLNSLSGGSILYNGNKLDGLIRDSITILLQKPYLFRKTSYENIISGLKYKKVNNKEVENRLNKYMRYLNTEELLSKKSHWLSGGERAKIALLRTAVLEAEVTMLDEPTAAMDIESSMKAEELIKDMSKDNKTVIVVTHDIYQAKRIADYVIFMDKGKILETGNKDDVFGNPKNKLLKQVLNM